MNAPTENDFAAPLPVLSGMEADRAAPRNDWRLLVDSVPLFFDPKISQPALVATKNVPAVPPSPFRIGELRFDADGIEIEGMALLTPPNWYVVAATLPVLPYIFLQLFGNYGRRSGISVWIQLTAFLVSFAFLCTSWFLRNWLEKRRADAKLVLSWESLRAMQTDTKLRSVTLVFPAMNVPKHTKAMKWLGVKPAAVEAMNWHYITLGKLEPSIVQGVTDTILHFAPNVLHEQVNAKRSIYWSHPLLRVLIIVGGLFIVGGIAAIFYGLNSRGRP